MISNILQLSRRVALLMVLALVAHPALMAQDEVEYKMEIGGAIGLTMRSMTSIPNSSERWD